MPQTPPPPGGGYGYPGAPTPPPPNGGYGYPGAPTQPYGAPQVPPFGTAQQPGQFPGYPGHPGAPAPGPGNGGSKQRMMAIVAGAVALVLLVGGGIWFATSGDDKDPEVSSAGSSQGTGGKGDNGNGKGGTKPQTVDGKLLFEVEQEEVKDMVNAKGMWVTDQVVAKSDNYKIVGYGLSGGKKWDLPSTARSAGPIPRPPPTARPSSSSATASPARRRSTAAPAPRSSPST
ncbi:hypothetical protein ACFQ2B_18990 [Streptomyces stramineus]